MNAESQAVWIASAVDALDGIHAEEVAHVSAEVRRSVTDHRKLVPAIAKLVAERRAHNARMRALPRREPELPEWKEPAPPLTRAELDSLSPELQALGIKCGALYVDSNGKYQNR